MFHPIDLENWDRKEIYTAFDGYTYTLTAELDVTEFLQTLKEKQRKFYPSICYCIARTVNKNQNYRYAKVSGEVGYWDQVQAHYTVLRKNTDHLFTHQRTLYTEDFPDFYIRFLEDKEKAENGDSLYFDKSDSMDNVHISIMPNTSFTGLSYSKPASFTKYGTPGNYSPKKASQIIAIPISRITTPITVRRVLLIFPYLGSYIHFSTTL